nr:hypothetical protein [Tanacetum cinerariifolium]
KSSKLRRLKKVGTSQRVESSEDEENEDSEVQEVVEVVNAAKLMTEVATTVASIPIPAVEPVVAAVSTPISAAKPKV